MIRTVPSNHTPPGLTCSGLRLDVLITGRGTGLVPGMGCRGALHRLSPLSIQGCIPSAKAVQGSVSGPRH